MSKSHKNLHNLKLTGAQMLRDIFPMLARLSQSGTERDRSRNRQLKFSQYAALILVGLFNPVLESARALVAASGAKKIRKLTGGAKTSLGSFSEASSVFDPQLLLGLIKDLRSRLHHQRVVSKSRKWNISDELVERLVAVDGSVLSALPQIMKRLGESIKGQWRLHAQVKVLDGTILAGKVTAEAKSHERQIFAQMLEEELSNASNLEEGRLFLMDRGFRSAELFNTINAEGHDYICRINRTDGKPVKASPDGEPEQKELSPEALAMGVIADEMIAYGGGCGASKIGSDHRIRRIKLIPVEGRPSAARQGRVRTDQTGRDELVLATTLMDLSAEEIVQLYEYRWQVELFFRFLKHVLGCNKLISAKTPGVQIQIYCALIASLLIALATGGGVTRRQFEMICLYFAGWADEEDLLESLGRRPP